MLVMTTSVAAHVPRHVRAFPSVTRAAPARCARAPRRDRASARRVPDERPRKVAALDRLVDEAPDLPDARERRRLIAVLVEQLAVELADAVILAAPAAAPLLGQRRAQPAEPQRQPHLAAARRRRRRERAVVVLIRLAVLLARAPPRKRDEEIHRGGVHLAVAQRSERGLRELAGARELAAPRDERLQRLQLPARPHPPQLGCADGAAMGAISIQAYSFP